MPGLYTGLMESVKNNIHAADAELLDRFQEAYTGALRGTMSASPSKIIAEAQKAVPGLTGKTVTIPLYEESPESIEVLNSAPTKRSIADPAGRTAFQTVLDANKTNTHTLIAKYGMWAIAAFVAARISVSC